MTINTERLKTDAKWWDENAPMGATHFNKDRSMWIMQIDHSGWYWDGEWRKYKNQERLELHMSNAEPRPTTPTTPAAPEWDGEGFPPNNERIDILGTPDGSWSVGVVDYVDHKHCVWHWDLSPNDTMYNLVRNMQFRPIRTAEQRQREELANEVSKAMYKVGYAPNLEDPESIAGAILSRYNLEPKP